ncbi:MAG TPA: aldo/keto reductase [Deinococcales bacterium]|nr:aldo/keto reductase [Deinococcales bacterium]
MHYRPLGKTGLMVSEIGFGAWGIGGGWGERRDDEALQTLTHALNSGINFIDTALAYGEGVSERLVGQAIRAADRPVVVASKVPPKNRVWPARPGTPLSEAFPRDYIVECTERSLSHLGLETLDVIQLHVWSDEWADQDDWKEAARTLKDNGMIRAFGLSINDHEADNALKALDTGLIDTVQVIYNIFEQRPEERLFPRCQELGVGVIVRVPFDEGGLTGSIRPDTVFEKGDWREHYFSGNRKQEVFDRVEKLRFLERDGRTLPEAALRFCLSNPAVSTVIPGMRSPRRVDENARAGDGKGLPAEDLQALKAHAWPRNFYRD